MFLAAPRPTSFGYPPSQISPLFNHDPNACPRFPTFAPRMAALRKDVCKPAYPNRGSKYATLVKNKDTESEKRRDLFQRKVKQRGEDRRWEVRGEQILRADYLSRQKQWEEEQARQAIELTAEPDDEEMVANDNLADIDIVEEYLTQEDRELSLMSSVLEDIQAGGGNKDRAMIDYGSDDEEYNQIFMDVLIQLEKKGSTAPAGATSQEKQAMDVIMG